jgi:small multidrug resistance pump
MNPWLALGIAIVAEVIGTSALKASAGFSRLGPSLLVIAGYAVAFWFLAFTLKRIPVGIAYAVWSGTGTVLITLIGVWLFRQRLDAAAMIGIALIIAGVLVLNLVSSAAAH